MTERLVSTIAQIRPLDRDVMAQAQTRQNQLTKPRGSLGRLEELSIQIAGIKRSRLPVLKDKVIITMAADHGVCAEGVSAYPQVVTQQMVLNFLDGGAGINVLARHIGARVIVVDMGVLEGLKPHPELICNTIDFGTKNMTQGPAMTRQQAVATIEAGITLVENEIKRGLDIVGTGDMGIGNTTAASAVCAAITGRPVADVTGRGTGINDEELTCKVSVIERALSVNQPDPNDAIDILAKVGGFEVGGLVGVILAAAANSIPAVIDGFISGAAALIAHKLSPQVKDYLIAAHISTEPGHRLMLEYLGLSPILDLQMRLGEGTGAALGISIAEAAVKVLKEMATFGEAGVSDKD